MESGRWMNFFCHSMQRQEDSPPATDCRLGDGPCISTCALLVESDGGGRKTWRYIMEFQSTLSSRRATVRGSMRTLEFTRFQSTLSSRRATVGPKNALQTLVISIHALLTESDLLPPWWLYSGSYFNPRSPCGERPGRDPSRGCRGGISIHALLAESDFQGAVPALRAERFQSTLSLRRATWKHHNLCHLGLFQSTLSLRRATGAAIGIQGGDVFQSTLSLRRATHSGPPLNLHSSISIHALLAESDYDPPRCAR